MNHNVILYATAAPDTLSDYSNFCLHKLLTSLNTRPVFPKVASCLVKSSEWDGKKLLLGAQKATFHFVSRSIWSAYTIYLQFHAVFLYALLHHLLRHEELQGVSHGIEHTLTDKVAFDVERHTAL